MDIENKLEQLFKEDLADRKAPDFDKRWPEIKKRDRARAKITRSIIAGRENAIGIHALYHAAFILHHQGTKRASTHARSLARRGMKLCEGKNKKICGSLRWMYAGTTDRLLRLSGKPQKYGTQYLKKKNGKRFELEPIDPRTTDEERKALNVLPLAEAKKMAKNFK